MSTIRRLKSFFFGKMPSMFPVLFIALFLTASLYSTHAFANAGTAQCLESSAAVNFDPITGEVTATMGGTGDNPICEMFIALQGVLLGKAYLIATIAIIALGAGALFGKISYPQALTVALGIVFVFGANTFIQAMDPDISLTLSFGSTGANYEDPISAMLGMIINSMTGPAGRAVAVVAIAILGLGAFFGKVTWIQTMVLVTGIGLVFGALNIVEVFQQAVEGGSTLGFLANLSANYTLFNSVSSDPLGIPFLNVIEFMTGDIGVSLATVAVICMGFAAMMGKVTWVQALMLATGIALVFGAADVVVILTSPLAACSLNNTDAFTQVICGFMLELQGPMGKTLATLAIIIIGILSMLGKVSWELGFVVTIGIALIFGADTIVSLFETNMNNTNCGTDAPSAPSTGNAIADVLCYIVMILYGPAGKALATVAVIMMGFGALLGKVSFSQAFVVAVGIAVTFGAPDITTILLPSANLTGCTATAGGSGSLINSFTFTVGDNAC